MTDHTRAMLEEAWRKMVPQPDIDIDANKLTLDGEEYWDSYDRFTRLLDAEAYLDAAVMLVPEGAWWWIERQPMGPAFYAGCGDGRCHYAETPALALLAAIMKAKNDE